MNIKSRLFKQPWEHKDPEVRIQAVRESNDPKLKAELGRLAEHDESANVRLAALKRINSEPFWLDARLRESEPAILEAADAYLAKAVMRKANPDMLKERLEWFRRIDDAELIRHAARHAPDQPLRAEALERISAQGFLGDCVIGESDDDLALSLLARIDQESTLERILGKLRQSSKKRARAAEDRLIEVRAASGKLDPVTESATRLVARAEELARGEYSGNRAELRDELEREWKKLDDVPDSLSKRFAGALSIVRRALDFPRTQAQQPADPGQADLADSGSATDPDLTRLGRALEELDNPGQTRPDEAGRLLAEFDRVWNRIEQPSAADAALKEQLLPIVRTLQKRREQTADGSAPKPADEPATDFDAALDKIAELLEEGTLSGAQVQIRELRSQFDRLPARKRPKAVGGRLHRMEGRLKEMRNWEHWSNNQVRDELIEQVEQLAESGQHPDAITATLKEARAEWQRLEDLEVLPGDKRRHAAPPGQWRRFQAACKNAFDQARPFFEKRHEVQADNLAQLKEFIKRGHEAAGDDEAKVDKLTGFMRMARQAIRRLDDLPPKSRGSSAAQLRELMDKLSARLDAGFEEIELAKRRLVTEAKALAHETDLKTAIEKAKSLQARWQQAGSGRRRIEQQLWKEFRAPIDPLFEKLRGDREEEKEQDRERIDELKALVQEAETLAALDDTELTQAEGRMKGLARDWLSRDGRPQNLNRRFSGAEEAFRARLAKLRNLKQEQARKRIDDAAGSLQRIAQARLGGSDDKPESLVPEIGDDSGNGLLAELAESARQLAADSDKDALNKRLEENERTARQIVIEMEFLAGVDSPAEDRQQRMDYQVQRLAQRLGERSRTPELADELSQLRERWYRALPLPPEQFESLAKRFQKCENVIESMMGT